MFICVKHGDNQQFLANTCCSVLLLLHYLRSKVGLRRTEAIDLCDELGTLKLLFLVKLPSDSASKFLSPRGTYYVCRVERGTPGPVPEAPSNLVSPPLSPARPLSADALRTQCEFLEKSRLKLLKAQDGKKVQTMESPGSGASGVADEEGAPRKAGPSPKIKPEASKKEKHR
uniref:Chromosome X open reading frame 65 n=1 Tax=Chelydra serpentina TaxID=8475 RepID=A0A8C3XPB7_CHESE